MANKLLLFFLLLSSLVASEVDKVSVQLLWKHQFEFAGFYIAKEKGFYQEANIDVELKEYQFGTNITKDVESGKSTFGVAYPNIILDHSNGAKIVLLNAIFQTSPHILVTLQSSGLNTVQSFKNKSVMIEDDAIKNAPLLSMLFSQKLNLSDIKLTKPSFNIDDLIEKKIDVFSAYSSNELHKLDVLGLKYNVFDPKDYGFDFYNDLLFTSQKLATTNPELVSRFQKATLKGWEYAFSHIDETIRLIEQKYNTQNKSHNALSYEAKILKSLAYKGDIPLGALDTNKLTRIQDIYGLMGLMKSDINFKEFVFDSKKIYLSKEEKDFIKNTTLKVSITKDCRPFCFENKDGHPSGISADYWNILVKELGLKVEYVYEDIFTKQLEDIKNKKVDVIISTGKTKDREDYALFSNPYSSFPVSIATQKNENFIEDFKEVLDKKIAVGRNFTAHKLLYELYPKTNFVFVESIEEGLKLVNKGEVYGFVDMKPALSYNIKRLGFENVKIAGNTGVIFEVSMMMRNDYPILKSILNKGIANTDTQKIDTFIKMYENIEFEKPYDFTIIYILSFGMGIIFVFILFRQYILKVANQNLQTIVDEKTKKLQELNENLEMKIQEAIKENKSKDMMLFQQSKMASMGEMIGNIAHQWRQPLSVISTSVTGLSFKMDYGIKFHENELADSLNRVNETAQFLSRTIDDFQDYLKPQIVAQEFNIKDVIEKNLDMFGKAFSNNDIEIVLNLEDVFIKNSKNELLQVTINILNNAKDALKESSQEEKLLFISVYKKNNFAVISIKDNAGGIIEEVMPKIFDAYFTTKHQSQGTGLGLFMSYQIVTNRFQGTIDVENEIYSYKEKEYKGANFKIILPL